MKRHKRDIIQTKARNDIHGAIEAASSQYELTHGEIVSILSSYLQSESKYMVRFERHGNYEDAGGLEKE